MEGQIISGIRVRYDTGELNIMSIMQFNINLFLFTKVKNNKCTKMKKKNLTVLTCAVLSGTARELTSRSNNSLVCITLQSQRLP